MTDRESNSSTERERAAANNPKNVTEAPLFEGAKF